MSSSVVVVGAGGFGREVLDVVEAMNSVSTPPGVSDGAAGATPWEILGVVDDSLSEDNRRRLDERSIPVLGTTEEFLARVEGPVSYAVGIGSPVVRRKVADRLDAAGHTAATLIHPSVTMGARVEIGAGTVLCAGVRLTTNITLGRHVHINLNVTVGHDTTVGDFVSLNPLASISGDCAIESDVLVGVGGIVLNGLRIGRGATVGGAACVVRDVEPATTVVGIPAKPLPRR